MWFIRAGDYGDRLQRLMPPGVQARAIYYGDAVRLDVTRGDDAARLKVLRSILDRDPDGQIRKAAEFLLQLLDTGETQW